MKKGQFFILSAVVICLAIAALANICYFSSLAVEKEEISISPGSTIMQNANTELIGVIKMDPDNFERIADFVMFLEEYGKEKNYNITINATGQMVWML